MPKRHPKIARVDPEFDKFLKKFKIEQGCDSMPEASKKLLEKLKEKKKFNIGL